MRTNQAQREAQLIQLQQAQLQETLRRQQGMAATQGAQIGQQQLAGPQQAQQQQQVQPLLQQQQQQQQPNNTGAPFTQPYQFY